MPLFVIGLNHKTATVEVREQIYFALDKISLYLQDLLGANLVTEAVLLSTCNRSELYCEAEQLEPIYQWFAQQAKLDVATVQQALYIHRDEAAIAHILQVACGLDSMVIGEPQILGQMKEAFSESCAAGAVNTAFYRLFQMIFMTAKEVRHSTSIGACPVSVASASVHFMKQQLPHFARLKVVLVGAGDTTELLLRYLEPQLALPITIVNRSLEKALSLASAYHGLAYGMESLAHCLAEADIVLSATGSAVPIITKQVIAEALKKRTDRPLFLLDIAVPRDIDPQIKEFAAVNLFCIDDLKAIIERNRQGREHAAIKARELIRQKSREFMLEMSSIDRVAHTIRAYRGQIEQICRSELIKAKQQLLQGNDPAEVLDAFAHAFTRKLLHAPSVQLRQAGAEGRFELLKFAKQLFAIPDAEAERL